MELILWGGSNARFLSSLERELKNSKINVGNIIAQVGTNSKVTDFAESRIDELVRASCFDLEKLKLVAEKYPSALVILDFWTDFLNIEPEILFAFLSDFCSTHKVLLLFPDFLKLSIDAKVTRDARGSAQTSCSLNLGRCKSLFEKIWNLPHHFDLILSFPIWESFLSDLDIGMLAPVEKFGIRFFPVISTGYEGLGFVRQKVIHQRIIDWIQTGALPWASLVSPDYLLSSKNLKAKKLSWERFLKWTKPQEGKFREASRPLLEHRVQRSQWVCYLATIH